ncbi:MAG: hypothetical protein OHK0052_12710 [Anaerolineales bacterium]
MTLPLRPEFTPAAMRLLTAEQLTLLESRLAADQTTIPNGTSAISYFLSLTNTVAFNFSGGVLNYTLPGLQLPPENQPQPLYAVTLADFHGTRAVRYAVDGGASLSSVDDFGFAWSDYAAPNYVDARGASLNATYAIETITRTLTGEPLDFIYTGEAHTVTVRLTTSNSGNDVAADTLLNIPFAAGVTVTLAPPEVTMLTDTLIWDAGDLAPGVGKSILVEFYVPAQFGGRAPVSSALLNLARARFVNVYAGKPVTTLVGSALTLPNGSRDLSATFRIRVDTTGDGLPDTNLQNFASVLTGTQTANGFTTLYFRQNTPLYAADVITLSVTFTPSEGAFLIYDGLRLGINGEPQPPLGVNAIRNDAWLSHNLTPTLAATFTSTNYLEATLTDLFDPRPYPNTDYRAAHGFGNSSAQVWVGEGATTSLIGFGEAAYLRWQINNNTTNLFGEVQLQPQPPAGVNLTPMYAYPFSTHWADAPFLHAANIPAGNYGIYLYRVQITDAALQGKVLEIPATLQANGLPVDFSVPAARLAVRTTDGDAPQITLGGARQLGGEFTLSPRALPLGVWLLNEMQYLQWQQLTLEDFSILPHTQTALIYLQSLGDGIPYGVANDILTYTLPANAAWLVANPQMPLHLVMPYQFYAVQPGSYPLGGGAHTLTDGLGVTTTVAAPHQMLQIEGAALTYQAAVCGITRTLTQTPAEVLYVGEENLVQVCLQLSNVGTHAAQTLQTRLPVLSSAQVVNLPPEITLTPQGDLLWEMATLEAAASRSVTFTLSVSAPVESGAGVFAATPWGSLPLVGAPQSRFVNAASLQTVTQPFTQTLSAPFGYPSGWQVTIVPELFLAQTSAGTCPAGLVGTPVQIGFVPAYCDVRVDLWIVLPAVNAPGAAQIVELALPLQNGFVLSPWHGSWQGSVSGTHTVFSDTHVVNGVEYVTLARSAPDGTAEQVQVQVRLHAKHNTTEGAVLLHGGARWFFGVDEYTAARWQLGAAAYSQGIWMARNALSLETISVHGAVSVYTSTLLTAHPLNDLYGFAAYPNAPYRNLWFDAGVAVQVLAGGSEAEGWQSSLINLGDTLGLRVTLANRGALPLEGVSLLPNAPAGVTVNPIDSQDNLPVSLRIQPAAFAPQQIAPGAVGVYYFEIALEPNAALQGKVIELPLTITAENLPVSLQAVTARFGVRAIDGSAPRLAVGQLHDLQVGITPAENVHPLACRVFDAAGYAALVQAAAADEALLPRGDSALVYFESAGGAGTLTQQAGEWVCALPADVSLPLESDARYVVFSHQVGAASVTQRQLIEAGFATAVDDFGSLLRAENGALLLPTRGARAEVVVDSVMMTRTLTGAISPLLYVRERNQVQICFALHNLGNAPLNEARARFTLNSAFSPLHLQEGMTLEGQSLIWQAAGGLAGDESQRGCATFTVWVNPYAYAWLEDPDTSVTPIVWGNLPVFAPELLAFVDAYSGLSIELTGGEAFTLAFGGDTAPQYQAYLPLAFGRALITFDAVQVGEAIPARTAQYPGETFYRAEITLPSALPNSGQFYLSSSASEALPIEIDDAVFISVDGTDVFSVTFSTAQIPPEPQMVAIPLETIRSWQGKTIVITYRDRFGHLVAASEVWLIWVP